MKRGIRNVEVGETNNLGMVGPILSVMVNIGVGVIRHVISEKFTPILNR